MNTINVFEFIWMIFSTVYTLQGINNAIKKHLKRKKRLTPLLPKKCNKPLTNFVTAL